MNLPPKGAKRRLAFVLLLVVWFLKCILGLLAAISPNTPSYPDAVRASPHIGDIEFYVVLPAVFVALNLLMYVYASKLPKWLAIIVVVLQIFLLLLLVLLGTGGI